MRVLVACEFSGIVRDAFRARGHDAWSCDLIDSEGDSRWHLKCDVNRVVDLHAKDYDLLLAFPPCTHLAVSGARWFKDKQAVAQADLIINLLENERMACEDGFMPTENS